MLETRRTRIPALVLLSCVLGGLLIWAGTVTPDPTHNRFPGTDELADDYAAHAGDDVEIYGTVVSTDRLPALVAGTLAMITWYVRSRVWTSTDDSDRTCK